MDGDLSEFKHYNIFQLEPRDPSGVLNTVKGIARTFPFDHRSLGLYNCENENFVPRLWNIRKRSISLKGNAKHLYTILAVRCMVSKVGDCHSSSWLSTDAYRLQEQAKMAAEIQGRMAELQTAVKDILPVPSPAINAAITEAINASISEVTNAIAAANANKLVWKTKLGVKV